MNLTLKTLTTIATGSIAALTIGGVAQAATLNANIGFIPVGSTTFTGSSLGAATSVTIPAVKLVNVNDPTYQAPGTPPPPLSNDFYDANAGGTAGAFSVTLGSTLSFSNSTLDLTNFTPFTVSFTAGGQPATFTATGLNSRGNTGLNDLNLLYLGNISGTGFDTSVASLSFAFTRVSGGSVNYSATLASPPAIAATPEPTTIVGLLAVGAAGLAGRRRKS